MILSLAPLQPEPAHLVPETTAFKKFDSISLPSDCAALVWRHNKDGDVQFFLPAGDEEEKIVLQKGDRGLKFQRQQPLEVSLMAVRFAGGLRGNVELRLNLRWINPSEAACHPLSLTCSGPEEYRNALTAMLDNTLIPSITTVISEFDYENCKGPTDFKAWINEKMDWTILNPRWGRHHGFTLTGGLEVRNITSEAADERADLAAANEEEVKRTRLQLQQQLANLSADAALEQARSQKQFSKEIEERKQALYLADADARIQAMELAQMVRDKKARTEMDLDNLRVEMARITTQREKEQLQKEEMLLHQQLETLEIENAKTARLAELTVQREEMKTEQTRLDAEQRRELERRRQETELKIREAEARNQGEKAQALREVSATLREISLAAESSDSRLENLEQEFKELLTHSPEPEEALGTVVVWRLHSAEGLEDPELKKRARLPTGSLLDVAVTPSREAYVYVLLKSDTDPWISLVPDTSNIMGITRRNLQQKGETVFWPGENSKEPGKPPFWMLDPSPGLERLVVVASIEELDVNKLLTEEGIASLREKSDGSRGFTNPAEAPTLVTHGDYHDLVTGLVGKGCIVDEFVFDHY